MDLASLDKWDDYTDAKESMFFYTDTADAPWTVLKSNDKKRARVAALRHVLNTLDYADKDHELVVSRPPDPRTGSDCLRDRRAPGPTVRTALTPISACCG